MRFLTSVTVAVLLSVGSAEVLSSSAIASAGILGKYRAMRELDYVLIGYLEHWSHALCLLGVPVDSCILPESSSDLLFFLFVTQSMQMTLRGGGCVMLYTNRLQVRMYKLTN